MKLLPDTTLARLLGGYFLYTGTPPEVDGEEEENKYPRQTDEDQDPVDIIMVGSVFGTLYCSLTDFFRKLLPRCPIHSWRIV